MKCLLVSDLHYKLKHFDWLVTVAAHFDCIIIAGDQIDARSHVYLRIQVPVILKYLEKLQQITQVMVCSGNHDLNVRGPHGDRIAKWLEKAKDLGIVIDGDSLLLGNTLFSVCPWWDGEKVKQQIDQQLSTDSEKEKLTWVWVYHGPPDNSPTSWTGKRHYGDAELAPWIRRFNPDVVLTGHIHEAPFVENGSWADRIESTWVLNSGRQDGSHPPHIVLDLHTRKAQWYTTQRMEYVEIDNPMTLPHRGITDLPDWLGH
jgi:Icc-related predicted phosphoesterase